MRVWFLCFAILCFWRVSVWHKNKQRVETVCAPQYQKTKSRKMSLGSIRLKAHRIESYSDEQELQGEKIYFKQRWESFNAKVVLLNPDSNSIPVGQSVEIWGEFRCSEFFYNLGGRDDRPFVRNQRTFKFIEGRYRVRPIVQRRKVIREVSGLIRRRLKNIFYSFPSLYGVVWAVWTGETKGLDPRLEKLYREGGLLPLVALSGQHVSIFIFLMRAISRTCFYFFFPINCLRNMNRYWEMILPILVSCLLAVTSLGSPSILRTLAMALTLVVLRLRLCLTSTAQVLSVSSAFLLLFDPSLLTGVSFILSVGGTYLLIRVLENTSNAGCFKMYFQTSITMSILSIPLVGFYFSKVSLLAPLCQIAANWLWTLIIIPIGFLVPILGGVPLLWRYKLFLYLEKGVNKITEVQLVGWKEVHLSYLSALRPTWWEAALLTGVLIFCVDAILNRKMKNGLVSHF